MQEDESTRNLWEGRALKLLKGKPLSSLTKLGLSGLTTNVVYADRPKQYATSMRMAQSWNTLEMQGRVAGKFDTAAKWTEGVNPAFSRVYQTDDPSEHTGRIEVVGESVSELITRLKEQSNSVIHADPFALKLLDGGECRGNSQIETVLDLLQGQDGDHPLTIDTATVFELGGTAKEELLWALLSLLQYAKRGIPWKSAWLHCSTDSNIMQTVVKFRALRQLMHGLASQLDMAVEYPYICAETSIRMFSRADEHNNMLRGLYASVGAVWGGVDGLVIHGYDALSTASEHAHRIAQNMHAVLKEESGLDNWMDPLFGSYQVESQTQELCAQVWTEFVSCSEEGLQGLIDNGFSQRIHQLRDARQALLSTQKEGVTGVTAFANPTERLGTEWVESASKLFVRDVQQIETVRAQFEARLPVSVQIVCLGSAIDCKPRLEYLQQQLATVGLTGEVVEHSQCDASASLRCVVGTAADYTVNLQETVRNLQDSGGSPVWVVGRLPKELESALDFQCTPIYKGVHMLERWGEVLQYIDIDTAGGQP